MDALLPISPVSAFMSSHLPDFFDHFGINFSIDGPQLEYFVYQKKTGLDISCSLTVCFDAVEGQIVVMSFYPGLDRHSGTRYLSAVCFFMVMQHFAFFRKTGVDCRICLKTHQPIFDRFYATLKDFNFQVLLHGKDDLISIGSQFMPLNIDTSMFIERALLDE